MTQLTPGERAPDFTLTDQDGKRVSLSDYTGQRLLLYFYPKAGTTGCTAQALAIKDAFPELADLGVAVLGISPDSPPAQKRFDLKHNLGFPLLADPDHAVAEAYGVWGTKHMYGRTFQGIIRSAFLVGEDGRVREAWYKVRPADTVPRALASLKV